ncbi:MAG TPA: Gfo/Idh/MocA family oxidoreductase [Solirubrobacteraceae bacterium]|nr:Gfo/Idh/MocA family oxidoreductase [Solirubrobacteraceae bacterium]
MALRVAIVGVGARGREWGSEVLGADGFDLVACVDSDPAALRGAAELGVPGDRLFGELEALDPGRVDAVIVATPRDHHVEPCRAALERDLAVLVEKPFTPDLAAAHDLAALAESRGVPLLVGQNYRYLRVHRAVRRIVHEGRLGAVRLVTAHHYRVERPADAGWQRADPLWDLAVHHLDALRDVLGQEVVSVTARRSDGGDDVQALLEFSGGTQGVYTITRRSSGHEYFEGGKEFYERIVGTRGTLHVLHRWLVLCETGKLPRIVRRGPRRNREDAALLGELDRAVRGHSPRGISARDNLGTVAALDACARSARERRWVAVEEREEIHA